METLDTYLSFLTSVNTKLVSVNRYPGYLINLLLTKTKVQTVFMLIVHVFIQATLSEVYNIDFLVTTNLCVQYFTCIVQDPLALESILRLTTIWYMYTSLI